MSETTTTTRDPGEPPLPPPESASNDPRDIAAGVSREASLATILAANEAAAQAQETDDTQAAPAEPAVAPPGDGASGPTPAPAATDEDTVDALLAKDNTPTWMKKEITKTRNQRREAEAARQQAEAALKAERDGFEKQLAEMKAQIDALKPPPEPPKPATPRPTREQFTTPEEYDTAVQAWGDATAKAAADKAIADARAAVEKEAADKRQAEQAATEQARITKMQESWKAKREKALEVHPDYAEVAERDDLAISMPVAVMLAEHVENGAEVMYHLGKNPTEAARIYALAPEAQLVQIGVLSAALANQQRPVVSRAPAPIRPLQASREQVIDTNREPSMDEVYERVRKRDRWGSGISRAN